KVPSVGTDGAKPASADKPAGGPMRGDTEGMGEKAPDVAPHTIQFDDDNNLWVSNNQSTAPGKIFVIKFDQKTEKFTPVVVKDGVPAGFGMVYGLANDPTNNRI